MNDKSRYHHKLSKEQKEKIREYLLDERPIKHQWIADQFGVKRCTIQYHKRKMIAQLSKQELCKENVTAIQ